MFSAKCGVMMASQCVDCKAPGTVFGVRKHWDIGRIHSFLIVTRLHYHFLDEGGLSAGSKSFLG